MITDSACFTMCNKHGGHLRSQPWNSDAADKRPFICPQQMVSVNSSRLMWLTDSHKSLNFFRDIRRLRVDNAFRHTLELIMILSIRGYVDLRDQYHEVFHYK